MAGSTIALMAAVTAVVYIELSEYQRESLLNAKETAAAAVTMLFADSCAAPVVFADDAGIKDALTTLSRSKDVAYAAVWSADPSGKIGQRLAELGSGPADLSSAPPALELRREAGRLVLVAPVRNPAAKLVGEVVVTISLARENAAIHDVRRRALLVSFAIATGITALLLAIARLAIVRPLGKLVLAANKIECGDSSDIDVRSNDEIGQLSSAFRSMAKAIRNREERISARNHDMRLVLDNVEQGFVTLDLDARVSEERSRVVDEWFGPAPPGMRFWEYLGRADANAGEWFQLVWSSIAEDVLPFDLCLKQLPRLLTYRGRTFDLAYRPILRADQLERVLVVMTDVTARMARERVELIQRDTMNIFRHILSDRSAFEEFFDEARALAESIQTFDGSDLSVLKRAIHTLKGNCAIFGIESVARLCHDLETELDTGAGEPSAAQKQALLALWSHVTQVRAQFSRDGGVVVEKDEYRAFLDLLRARTGHDHLATRFVSWQFEPASKRLEFAAEQMKQLAVRLGKGDVDVHFAPTKLRLPPKKWAPFWAAFTHVLRNAVDHGIETPEERAAVGKSKNAVVLLSLTREGNEVVVSLEDDGRGMDWEMIAERARALGLPHGTAAELEASLFVQGLSSRSEVTSTSGRGVGLTAVRETMQHLDGRIAVHSERGVGTTFRFFLPLAMLVDDFGQTSNLSNVLSPDQAAARAGN